MPLGESHLRGVIAKFVQHYHHERNHQGLDNALIVPGKVAAGGGEVIRSERLGGLLGFYCREAA